MVNRLCILTAALSVVLLLQKQPKAQELTFSTMCDASAGIALDDQHFVAVNDEDNVLRIFCLDRKEPVFIKDLSPMLGIAYDDKSPEADLEGAARLGEVIYFISSHGRDKEGRLRKNRHRFFALRIERRGDDFVVQPFGKPYGRLLDDLIADPVSRHTGLKEAYQPQKKKDDQLRPKKKGVNIEGLAAGSDGKSLLIGFRNPRPKGKALLVPLLNPERVLLQGETARFGAPVLLDLHGLGIRSLERMGEKGCLLIIAGGVEESKDSALFVFDDLSQETRRVDTIAIPRDWTPESLFFYPDGRVQILSDDGTVPVRNSLGSICPCKEADEPQIKTFRSLILIENPCRN
ncbi:MAG: DUF3616 domain-containing protein [candidate division KSB1 bacterium]|nr:DUF3616 domain-containing protein [candidate division KSB1 bacterium]